MNPGGSLLRSLNQKKIRRNGTPICRTEGEIKMKKTILIATSIFALAGCAPQQALLKQTASGNPEGRFANTTLEEVKNKLVSTCASGGLTVYDASPNQVVCGQTMTGQEAVWAQLLIGNSYSTTPERKVRFTSYQSGQDVIVTGGQWIETQMAFGQMKRVEMNSNNQKNDLQQLLIRLGAD